MLNTMTMNKEKEFYRAEELAEALQVNIMTIYRLRRIRLVVNIELIKMSFKLFSKK